MGSERGRLALVVVGALVALQGCGAATAGHDGLDALLWVRSSAEYRVATESTFRAAGAALERALGDPTWSAALEQTEDASGLPPAVILDVDETVLDNSGFEAELLPSGAPVDWDRWNAWLAAGRAEAVAGATEFVARARQLGVAVFYVTNRAARFEAATRHNLAAFGLLRAEGDERLLLQGAEPGWGRSKVTRRAFVAKTHRVLLLVGDDLNDFVPVGGMAPAERRAVADRHRARWGERWFLVPNPGWGTWKRALVDYEEELSPAEKRRRKLRHLRR